MKSSHFLLCLVKMFLVSFWGNPVLLGQVGNPIVADKYTFGASRTTGNVTPVTFFDFTSSKEGNSIMGNLAFSLDGFTSIAVSITSPFSNDSKEVRPLNLEGLSKSSQISFGFQRIFWKPNSTEDQEWKIKFFRDYEKKKGVEYDDSLYIQSIKLLDLDTNVIKEEYQFIHEIDTIKSKKANWKINDYDQLDEGGKKEFDQKGLIKWGTPVIFDLEITLARKDFRYVLGNAFNNILESRKTDFALGASLGLFTKNFTLFKLGASYQVNYQSGPVAKYNIPEVGRPDVTKTEELSIGAPQSNNSFVLKLEMVKYLNGNKLGINPFLNYSLEDDVISIEVPIYFLREKKGKQLLGLNGGVYFGWKSDRTILAFNADNIDFGVFIGTNFGRLFE